MGAILGISAYYHDAAAAIARDGWIVAAAQEERFTRRKHDPRFPANAIAYCLREAGLRLEDLDGVAFYDKPLLTFERLLENYIGVAPRGRRSFTDAMPQWMKEKLFLRRGLRRALGGYEGRIFFAEHHESHAASAFFPSPFREAAILTVDGVGEWATASYGVGRDGRIELHGELRYPHSLGLLYSAFTYHAGFKVNSGEYKLMGLAPYGRPRYADRILERLVHLRDDGSFKLDLTYFNFHRGRTMTNDAFSRLFDGPPRELEADVTEREMDLAASVQQVTEEIVLRMARHLHRTTGLDDVCLAGGVALNCVANGRLVREGPFRRVWIQPAAGDAGGAVGVALVVQHHVFGVPRTIAGSGAGSGNGAGNGACDGDGMQGAYLGPQFSDHDIESALDAAGALYEHLAPDELVERTARLLAAGKVVGWFQGRMEFGPRALGNRSILGDPRSPEMQSTMNLKIKFREGFRPFAPSILHEHAAEYFALDRESPYMLLVAPVQPAHRIAPLNGDHALTGFARLRARRSDVPAVTHVDHSARVQTVTAETNPLYHALLTRFHAHTGCPLLVNTSFNVRGEPIVCTPTDAYRCFMQTGIDALAIGRFLLLKTQQPPLAADLAWPVAYAPD
jgi:carbamoyltransferase